MFRPPPGEASESTPDARRDRELLCLIGAGDRRALEQLYLNYQRRLAQFLSRLTPRRDAWEEAINDTFWIVWQKAGEFRGASRVSTWIMGIAWRCALKALRRAGAPEHDDGACASAEPAVDDAQAAQELHEWLEDGLRSLPFEQRATIELAYYVGYSCEEIAVIMNCPVNTVKARMFQARIKLRNLLPRLGGMTAGDLESGVRG